MCWTVSKTQMNSEHSDWYVLSHGCKTYILLLFLFDFFIFYFFFVWIGFMVRFRIYYLCMQESAADLRRALQFAWYVHQSNQTVFFLFMARYLTFTDHFKNLSCYSRQFICKWKGKIFQLRAQQNKTSAYTLLYPFP